MTDLVKHLPRFDLRRAGAFAKYHALGNDYLVLDAEHFSALTHNFTDAATTQMMALCARHSGIGADGVLLKTAQRAPTTFALRIFNPDGSTAEKSGNGLRIFARCMLEAGYLQTALAALPPTASAPTLALQLEVADSPSRVQLYLTRQARHWQLQSLDINMGQADFDSTASYVTGPVRELLNTPINLPGEAAFPISVVSLGNPHCVRLVPQLDDASLRRLGPLLEHHPWFTQRTNVQWLQVVHRRRLALRIWERGVGLTSASGSSSCAAFAVAHRLQLVDDAVEIHMPGGILYVQRTPQGDFILRGPATPVCHGIWGAEPPT